MDKEILNVITNDSKRNTKNEDISKIAHRIQQGQIIIGNLSPSSGTVELSEDHRHNMFLAGEYTLLLEIKEEGE